MPQDSLRSAVYRSLVTCNDPNGIVEYGTMRKSKSALRKKEKKIEKLKAREGLIESEVHKDVRQGVLPPFEILEISKGAQRLNLMIDSWSKGIGFEGNESKDIARDLLKGALDLQESLVMLCNLQETSMHFGQMNNEHNRLYKGGSHSDRFTEEIDISNMLPARHSVDGSARSSSAELKRVIRESLARQNLLSAASDQEDQKKLDFFSDIPSTSSSQSSANSNNSASMDWSVSSTSKETKAKSPNVIAKLMGLEKLPSHPSPPRLKQQDSKKIVVHKRLITDIEMPNVRNAYPISRSNDPQKKTLKEIIDTMHLKGLLKDYDVEGLAQCSHNPRYSLLKENEETSPIVVIKPLPFSRREKESLPSFRKLEVEEVSSSEMSSQGEGALETEDIHNKLEARREQLTNTSIHNNKARKLKSISVKVEPKEKPIRRSIQQERNSNSTVSKGKQVVREHRTRGKASANAVQLGSAPLTHKPEEKGARNKKHEEVKKVLSNRKIPEEKSNERRITLSRSSLQDAATSVKSRNHYSSQNIPRDPIPRQESPAKKPIPVRSRQSTVDISPGQAKNNATRTTKPVKESVTTIPATKRSQSKQRNAGNKQTDNMGSVSTVIRSDPEDHRTAVNDTGITKTQIEDHDEEERTSRFEAETDYSQQRSSTESTEERTEILDHQVETKESAKNKMNLKELVLSNSSFIRRAKDLYELHMNQPILSQAAFSEDVNMMDTRLALDCANELLESKSRRISPADHSFSWIHTVNIRTSMSLDQLLGEVSQDFDEVINYAKVGNDIHKMVQCDIQCKRRPINGAWELDWESGFSVKEADQVFDELEKYILSELIEEIIIVDYGTTVVQHLQYF